jgi:predicted component of type VI protein secretion system
MTIWRRAILPLLALCVLGGCATMPNYDPPDVKDSVPRFGESVIAMPVTVSVLRV